MAKLDKELKKKVEFLQDILQEDYNNWLNKKHEEYIKDNEKILWEYAKKGIEQEDKLRKEREGIINEETINSDEYY